MQVRQSGGVASIVVHACIALAMSACGGGGGGGSANGPPPAPTVTLSASPVASAQGGSSQLTWTSTNAVSCTASGGWTGQREPSGSASTGALFAPTTFSLSCAGAGGSSQAAVTVTILPMPVVTISVTPAIVRDGATSQLTWVSNDATSCQASDGWTGDRPLSGTQSVGPVTQRTSFALTCTGAGGTASASALLDFRPGVNVPPLVNAGPDQTVFSTESVRLFASGSDPDGTVSAIWQQTSGAAVTLNRLTPFVSTFTAPIVTSDQVLTFSATVTDDEGAISAPDTIDITVQPVPAQVTLRGQVLYERVPLDFRGLRYPELGFVELSAEVLIEAVDATTQAVIASGRFAGNYELSVPGAANIMLRATAETARQAPLPLPHWQIAVRDLDVNGAPLGPVHSYTSPAFSSRGGVIRHLQIPSGWTSTGQLVGPRAAAPFAILDSVQAGLVAVLNVLPGADFPPLTIDWGLNNAGGLTFYQRTAAGRRIVLAAEVDVDTDEYDPPVILHEFGHYLDDSFARSDSIGGSHSIGERVDMRVAFGEGLATAFSSMARNNPEYRDSFGVGQGAAGFFSIENDSAINEGWYSESSAHEIVWDLFDGNNDAGDTVARGFTPIFNVWLGAHAQTQALTSIFSFMTAFKQAQPADAAAIDTLLSGEQIVGPTLDIYGSTETNNAGSSDVLPVYTSIALGGSVSLRSTNAFGFGNKLSTHRYLTFTLAAPANVRFDVTAAAGRDPDIAIFRRGVPLAVDMGPSNESFTVSLEAGDYILDVYDCGNAGCNDTVPPAPTQITVAVTAI